jgi:predicted secreted Zn-dependent protease
VFTIASRNLPGNRRTSRINSRTTDFGRADEILFVSVVLCHETCASFPARLNYVKSVSRRFFRVKRERLQESATIDLSLFGENDMQTKLHPATRFYLLWAVAIIVSFACNAILPKPPLSIEEVNPTAAQEMASPTEVVPTVISPAQLTEPTAASAQNSGVTVTREEKYYQIAGATPKELRKQLDKYGPIDKETGKKFDARTDWVIEWHYYYNESANECKIDTNRVNVTLTLTFTYPEWKYPPDASSSLVDKWNTYVKNLTIHEEGHASIANEGAQIIYDTIMDMPSSTACAALEKATNAIAQEKIDEIKKQEKQYDKETEHGKIQGAIFPP